ncbi:hypothetical protein GCM10010261_39030 [Streptomyces pilosus]|uniref:Uncharacterized protein n=1 Tax=Streptomyces pilosus TaxID=28893 RepID=A0A918EUL2_9ACTN|nr:hypothetical protein GCM10010280_16130 [Streptomyces pilosus]GGV55208.1 hypothetical protein GCM10010261_39030 [Streptomyces pilosus]
MDGTRFRQDERSTQESRARGTMRIWQWARWAALVLAVSWAVSWVVNLLQGEGGRDLWWPLVSTVIWTGVAVNGFVTYRRIRTTTLPALTGRPSA